MRRLAIATCAALALAGPAGAGPSVAVLGYTVHHRPIRVVLVGDPHASHRVLVVGCIHGNEQAGIAIARSLERVTPPRDVALWIVPILNPDGVAADTRQNAHGVDLNRNFSWRWRDLEGVYDSGSKATSEPETRAAMRLILRVRPTISIWYHQHLNVVDESGGNVALERKYAQLVGLVPFRLKRYPGSVAGWENHVLRRSTAFVVELPGGRLAPRDVARHEHAVLKLAATN